MKKFGSFCNQYNVMDPFPVSKRLLCSFTAYMADAGLSPQTVKSYLAAIRNAQFSLGLPDPREQSSLSILKRVQEGISRARLGRGQPSRVRLPVTAQLLRRIKRTLEQSKHPESRLLWAEWCSAFFVWLGELLLPEGTTFDQNGHLGWGDMAVNDPKTPRIIRFHLKQSKSDQFGRGADIVLGRTGCELCPVAAVLSYTSVRGTKQGPFFVSRSGKPLFKSRFVAELRNILESLGLPPTITQAIASGLG